MTNASYVCCSFFPYSSTPNIPIEVMAMWGGRSVANSTLIVEIIFSFTLTMASLIPIDPLWQTIYAHGPIKRVQFYTGLVDFQLLLVQLEVSIYKETCTAFYFCYFSRFIQITMHSFSDLVFRHWASTRSDTEVSVEERGRPEHLLWLSE